MNAFAPNATIFKIFLISLLPLILIILYCIAWLSMYVLLRKHFGDIKRNIVVSIIVILFMQHPALTKSGLSLFQCVKVDDGDSRVRIDTSMK